MQGGSSQGCCLDPKIPSDNPNMAVRSLWKRCKEHTLEGGVVQGKWFSKFLSWSRHVNLKNKNWQCTVYLLCHKGWAHYLENYAISWKICDYKQYQNQKIIPIVYMFDYIIVKRHKLKSVLLNILETIFVHHFKDMII